jgi:cation diffusion facilitator CzcD-associated flavoprotein CzcO
MIVAGDRWRLEPGAARKAMEQEYRRYLEAVRDPELRRKLTPDYQIGCVRIPKSDRNYYEAVQKPNVTLEFGRIARIVPDGVEMEDGTKHQLDVLVYATGFDTHAYLRPIKVSGLNGVTLDELWANRIFSYAGVALPGFPNMFLLFGPFSPVNNVPVPMGLDQEIGYIMKLVEHARRTSSVIAPTATATDRFLERVEKALPNTTFVACSNWYSDNTGTPILWPFSQDEHKSFLSSVDWNDFEITQIRDVSDSGENAPAD